MSFEDEDEETNLNIFKDCLFNIAIERSNPQHGRKKGKSRTAPAGATDAVPDASQATEPSQLVDFSDFLANEVFPSLPKELQTISHYALQDNVTLSDRWSLPLSLGTYEELADRIPPSVTDSLQAYGLISPPASDVQSFLSPVIAAYLLAATAPPPKWIETKVSACEICERDWVPMTYHHLIPRAVHAKVLKRGWHEERTLNSVAWLCRACHSFVHRMASNEELAKEWYTVERICEREDVQKWAMWVGKVRWKKR
ncbi:hypothetical protein PMZ80_005462 [Knufia obscura]|uniref:Uncharacterized protein n=1 Tax=Knufia obscura TaxID=1635080 RepID=A0ABR0RQM3_9EURO|nr:hypothetical protein PMZ80_005462 [Knufia obscura]